MLYIDFIKNMWNQLYDPDVNAAEIVGAYFHHDYEQCINGIILNRTEYIKHILEQRKNMLINAFDFKHVLENENELFALYYVAGKNINNQLIEAEVIAYYRFMNQLIYRIHGQVRVIKGSFSDADMNE